MNLRNRLQPLWHLNLHVGLIAWAILLSAGVHFDTPIPPALQALVFCAALCVYGLDRWGTSSPEDAINHPQRTRWLREHPVPVLTVIALALTGVAISLVFSPPHTRLIAAGYMALAALYTRRLLPGQRRLQDFPGVKIPCVVLGWAALPLLHPELAATSGIFAWICYRAGWLLSNVLWSEWRDRAGDMSHPTRTPKFPDTFPKMLRLSRAALFTTLLLGLAQQANIDVLGPAAFFLLQEIHAKKHPDAFAERVDFLLLLAWVLPVAG
ncbi:MAG: hypothetical protein JJU29_01645 [Verrucomicrobia bacterium]|nr:hypothetical protein [Verrucomicrobiota bacterium]MCH8512808.1 hypothetical protein [Kiritimatiellia bacterium]